MTLRHGIRTALVLAALLWAAACAAPQIEQGPGAEITHDGLHRVDHSRFQRAWVKPGGRIERYSKLLPLRMEIRYKHQPSSYSDSDNFPLTDEQVASMRKMLREVFEQELVDKGGWEIASAPGPGVLEIRGGLIDLVLSAPPEPSRGRSDVYVSAAGAVTLLIELHDSQSGEILARIADRRTISDGSGGMQDTSVGNRAALRRTFHFWGRRLREGLEAAKTLEPAA